MDKYVSTLYEHLKCATLLAHATADKEAQGFKRIYDRRAGAVALHPGDKVLMRLDTFIGARRKLKNWWHSQIHTVVCRMADGVPTYVVRNDSNGKEDVFHQERLLLWIAADADKDDGMRSNSAITVQVTDGLVEGDTTDVKAVSLDGDYRLSLAMFRTMIGPSHHMTGRKADTSLSGVMQKGVGQGTSVVGDKKPPMAGEAVPVEDIPP